MIYSDTLPDKSLAAVVRGIGPHEDRPFISGLYESSGFFTAYKATRLPHASLWLVREYNAAANGPDLGIRQKTVLSNVSFFDALHYCAQMDKKERALGKIETTEPKRLRDMGLDGLSAWQAIARNNGQPLDVNSMPLPAANGEIIADGYFTKEAVRLAQTTQGRSVVLAKPSYPTYDTLLNVDPSSSTLPVAQMRDHARAIVAPRHALTKQYNRAVGTLKLTGEDLLTKYLDGRLACTGAAAGGIASAAIGFAVTGDPQFVFGGLVGGGFFGAMGSVGIAFQAQYQFWRVANQIKRLPDGEEKTMMLEFQRTSKISHFMVLAAEQARSYKSDKNLRHAKKAESWIRKAAALMEISDEDALRFIKRVYDGTFPDSNYFKNELEKHHDKLKDSLRHVLSPEGAQP